MLTVESGIFESLLLRVPNFDDNSCKGEKEKVFPPSDTSTKVISKCTKDNSKKSKYSIWKALLRGELRNSNEEDTSQDVNRFTPIKKVLEGKQKNQVKMFGKGRPASETNNCVQKLECELRLNIKKASNHKGKCCGPVHVKKSGPELVGIADNCTIFSEDFHDSQALQFRKQFTNSNSKVMPKRNGKTPMWEATILK